MSMQTKQSLTIEIPGDAVAFSTKTTAFHRNGHLVRGTRKTDAAADWEYEVRRLAAEKWNRPLMEGPVLLEVVSYFLLPKSKHRKRTPRDVSWKTTKPDCDKILRLIGDALSGIVYVDDAQVCDIWFRKRFAAQGCRAFTEVRVEEIE